MKPACFMPMLVLLPIAPAFGQIVSYDAAMGVFPEEQGWDRNVFCTPVRWFENGLLHHEVEVGECGPPPGGDKDRYRLPVDEFIGVEEFFVEWRMATDATEPWSGSPGAVVSVWNQGGVTYWFGFAHDEVQHTHDAFKVFEFFDIAPGMHTYHLRIFNDVAYSVYIDGELVFEGIPAGPYPDFNPYVLWMTRAWTMDNHTQWSFVRYGVPPIPGSGDLHGDGQVDDNDVFYFEECLSSEAGNWIGCEWADLDSDGDVDCSDAVQFSAAWTGAGDPPVFTQCAAVLCSPDLNDDGTVDAADLAILLGAWGPNPGHAADLTGDDVVNASDLAMLLGAWGPC